MGFAPANWRTIKSRSEDLDVRLVALRRKDKQLSRRQRRRPATMSQRDRWRSFRSITRGWTWSSSMKKPVSPSGRPWITLAIDVFTRMVTGFYLTMAAPSRLSTSLALLHSVHDKAAWLREREIDAVVAHCGPTRDAPCPTMVSDFRSRAFERACRDAGIKNIWRIPGEPHYGGHIERLIGTMMGAVRFVARHD